MEPAIPDGCWIRVDCGMTDPQVGQSIAVETSTGITTHRTIYRGRRRRTAACLLTRGDARRLPDPPTTRAAVLGVVTEILIHGDWVEVTAVNPRNDSLMRKTSGLLMSLAMEMGMPVAHLVYGLMTRGRALAHRLSGMGAKKPRPVSSDADD